MRFECQQCGEGYRVIPSRQHKTKYCSLSCSQGAKGKKGGAAGRGVSRNKGAKRPDLTFRNKTYIRTGSEVWNWRGDKASYATKHAWMTRQYGRPKECEDCGATKNLQWANISGEYQRVREDWRGLCAKCHMRFDADIHQEAVNRRSKKFSFRGERLTLQEIADRTGNSAKLIRERIQRYGWGLEAAAITPPHRPNPQKVTGGDHSQSTH